MHLIHKGTFKSNRECFCGLGDQYIEIQNEFRELNDLHGQTQLMPNPKKNSSKPSDKNKAKYRRRCIAHRIEGVQTLKDQDEHEVYIALWHFDLRLLQKLGDLLAASHLRNWHWFQGIP